MKKNVNIIFNLLIITQYIKSLFTLDSLDIMIIAIKF